MFAFLRNSTEEVLRTGSKGWHVIRRLFQVHIKESIDKTIMLSCKWVAERVHEVKLVFTDDIVYA